ncbi:hypothetical protein Q5P01_021250 [Channa striata]|uniref:Microtubule-associated protein 10 C-terminal domain-containing protein n=1 Tax=Channa striata TaxID=64152 RepID=A0AA88RXZ3_CHASR|nr:hypothetical protein Q5P01_021250 [Channa striata]
MVLDVKEDIPKLVGSSTISLAKGMDRISQDVSEYGVSTPSAYEERGTVYLCSLTGDKIGSISLSYKLLSLGSSLLPHVISRSDLKSARLHEGPHVQKSISESFSLDHEVHSPTLDRSDKSENIQNNGQANVKISKDEDRQDDDTVCPANEHKPKRTFSLTEQETENSFEEDFNIFCPPQLYYTFSPKEKNKTEGEDYTFFKHYPEAVTFEESEDDTVQNEVKGPSSPVIHRKVAHNTEMSRNKERGGLNPNVLEEAVKLLHLLNPLLVELSQLNGKNQHQPLSVHPSHSWIYSSASTEPSVEQGKTQQTKSSQKAEQTNCLFKHLHVTRNCSTPNFEPTSVKRKTNKQKEALLESNRSSKARRKKLVYGTTKTFNLRLELISPPKVKQRECMEVKHNDTHTSVVKEKTKPRNKIVRSNTRKSTLNQTFGHNDNIETMIQNITAIKNMHGNVHGKQDRDSLGISEKCSLSERDLKFIHIPTVNSDSVARNKDRNEHHSESNQSHSESDKHIEKIESSKSTRRSSPKSSFSDSSGEGNEEAEYADDFNSLEPSDAYSHDPVSSPELSRAKTPKSPICPNLSNSDSSSDSAHKRTIFPMPIKAPSSPQRALRGTHIIRPRTHTSALSFSSDDDDDDDRDGSLSLQTRKKITKSSRMERTSAAESFMSIRGESSESTKTSGPAQGFPAESVSHFEQQEAEELEDVLGSLDFRKEYQHISELVTNKAPGYTV